MRVRYPSVDVEHYHSLWFWMYYLRGKRREMGYAVPSALDTQLVRRIRRAYAIWWVDMRYRPDQAQPDEGMMIYDDVTWLRSQRVFLWT